MLSITLNAITKITTIITKSFWPIIDLVHNDNKIISTKNDKCIAKAPIGALEIPNIRYKIHSNIYNITGITMSCLALVHIKDITKNNNDMNVIKVPDLIIGVKLIIVNNISSNPNKLFTFNNLI